MVVSNLLVQPPRQNNLLLASKFDFHYKCKCTLWSLCGIHAGLSSYKVACAWKLFVPIPTCCMTCHTMWRAFCPDGESCYLSTDRS
eukprot:2364248-Amphidinium_carterae.1